MKRTDILCSCTGPPQPAIPGTFQDYGKLNLRFPAALPPARNLLEHPTTKSKLPEMPALLRVTPGENSAHATPTPTHPAPRRGANTQPRTWPPQRSPRCRAGAGRAGTCGRPADHSAAAFVWPNARNGLFPFSPFKVKSRPCHPFLSPGTGLGEGGGRLAPGASGAETGAGWRGRRRHAGSSAAVSLRADGDFSVGILGAEQTRHFRKIAPCAAKRSVCGGAASALPAPRRRGPRTSSRCSPAAAPEAFPGQCGSV